MSKKVIYAEDLLAAIRDDPSINGAHFARIRGHIEAAPGVGVAAVPVLGEKTAIIKEDLLHTVLDHFGIDLAYLGKDLQFCQEAIDMAPAIDPVHAAGGCYCQECKSCKLCYPEKQIGKEATPGWYCKKHKSYRRPDDFCSYGERKCDGNGAL